MIKQFFHQVLTQKFSWVNKKIQVILKVKFLMIKM